MHDGQLGEVVVDQVAGPPVASTFLAHWHFGPYVSAMKNPSRIKRRESERRPPSWRSV